MLEQNAQLSAKTVERFCEDSERISAFWPRMAPSRESDGARELERLLGWEGSPPVHGALALPPALAAKTNVKTPPDASTPAWVSSLSREDVAQLEFGWLDDLQQHDHVSLSGMSRSEALGAPATTNLPLYIVLQQWAKLRYTRAFADDDLPAAARQFAHVRALLRQATIYTWTDQDGEEHFTDDPSSIPKGVKPKTMAPGEVETITTTPQPAPGASPDGGVFTFVVPAGLKAPPKPKVDTCEKAKKRLADAEAQLAEARKRAAEPPERNCQAVLNTHGQGAYAHCMARRSDPSSAAREVAAAERQVESAKDELRRAQAAGCQ